MKVAQLSLTLCDPMDSTVHGIIHSNAGVGCHFLLQGIFPTQGLNPGLPHCRWFLYQLNYKGSPGPPRNSLDLPLFQKLVFVGVPAMESIALKLPSHDKASAMQTFSKVDSPSVMMSVCVFSRVWPFASPWTNPPDSSVHGDSSGKNSGVGCHSLLQGIFSTQELNRDLLHCRQILWQMSYQGSLPLMMSSNVIFCTASSAGISQGLRYCFILSCFYMYPKAQTPWPACEDGCSMCLITLYHTHFFLSLFEYPTLQEVCSPPSPHFPDTLLSSRRWLLLPHLPPHLSVLWTSF